VIKELLVEEADGIPLPPGKDVVGAVSVEGELEVVAVGGLGIEVGAVVVVTVGRGIPLGRGEKVIGSVCDNELVPGSGEEMGSIVNEEAP